MESLVFPDRGIGDGAVLLRIWCRDDAAVKATWGADEAIVRWTGVPANYTEEQALAYQTAAERSRREGRGVALAIVETDTGLVVGSCDVRRPDSQDPQIGEVGYLLAAGARGRGLATRAVGLLVEWSFRELGMGRLQALVSPDNAQSAGVVERLGFQREGLLRHYRPGWSGREDRLMWALLPGELRRPAPVE